LVPDNRPKFFPVNFDSYGFKTDATSEFPCKNFTDDEDVEIILEDISKIPLTNVNDTLCMSNANSNIVISDSESSNKIFVPATISFKPSAIVKHGRTIISTIHARKLNTMRLIGIWRLLYNKEILRRKQEKLDSILEPITISSDTAIDIEVYNKILAEDPSIMDPHVKNLAAVVKQAELTRLNLLKNMAQKEEEYKQQLNLQNENITTRLKIQYDAELALKEEQSKDIESKLKLQSEVEEKLRKDTEHATRQLEALQLELKQKDEFMKENSEKRKQEFELFKMELSNKNQLEVMMAMRKLDLEQREDFENKRTKKQEESRFRVKLHTTVYDVLELNGTYPKVDGAEFSIEFTKVHQNKWGEYKREQISSMVRHAQSQTHGWSAGFFVSASGSYTTSQSWVEGNDWYTVSESETNIGKRICLKITGKLFNNPKDQFGDKWWLLYNPEQYSYTVNTIADINDLFVRVKYGKDLQIVKQKMAPLLMTEYQCHLDSFDEELLSGFMSKCIEKRNRSGEEKLCILNNNASLPQIQCDNHPLITQGF